MAKSSSDEKIKGMYVKIGGDTSEYTAAMKGLNADINSTTKNLNSVNKLLKLDPTNVEYTAQKQKLLSEAIEATKQSWTFSLETRKISTSSIRKASCPLSHILSIRKSLKRPRRS